MQGRSEIPSRIIAIIPWDYDQEGEFMQAYIMQVHTNHRQGWEEEGDQERERGEEKERGRRVRKKRDLLGF